eukprot:gene14079-16595_t
MAITVALVHQRVDKLKEALLDVSNPNSPHYGRYWKTNDILELISQRVEDVELVKKWLANSGCTSIVGRRDHVMARATISVIKRMFKVTMYFYSIPSKNITLIRSNTPPVIPSNLKAIVNIVTGIYELPNLDGNLRQSSRDLEDPIVPGDLGIVTPWTVRHLYNIPTNFTHHPKSSLSFASFHNRTFLFSDLEFFSSSLNTTVVNISRIVGDITSGHPDIEAALDVEYGGSVSPTPPVLSFWLGSNWLYEHATSIFHAESPPLVVSISYGTAETEQCTKNRRCGGQSSEDYVDRVNIEYMKLGLLGITVIVASGDNGAPGELYQECRDAHLSATFPGSSPFVTSVGATMVPDNSKPHHEVPASFPEALITTGGGFSAYSAMPEYQASAVNLYLGSGVKLPPKYLFNSTNRAVPDISIIGHNLYTVFNGQAQLVDGTSAAAPIFAGMVAMLNSQRLNKGKPPLGFINPLLYHAPPKIFKDITEGDNKCTSICCGLNGFQSTAGWDAVTGIGSISDFAILQEYIDTLN